MGKPRGFTWIVPYLNYLAINSTYPVDHKIVMVNHLP
jgi:hypothetical protein